jgi:hypothetical protein
VRELGAGVRVAVHDRSSAHVARVALAEARAGRARAPLQARRRARVDAAALLRGAARRPLRARAVVRELLRQVRRPLRARVRARGARVRPREAARWSADRANFEAYVASGRRMDDVLGVPLRQALRDLPPDEAEDDGWPYNA